MDVRSRFAIAAALTPLALAFAPDAHATDGWDGGKWRGCASAASPRRQDSLQVVGLTSDQRLICFNERRPQNARDIGFVSGVVMDRRLVGIDFRVQDGMLYGVGDAGGVYQLDTRNATATLVNRLTVPLQRNVVRRRLQPGRRSVADRQRHRAELAPQHQPGRHDGAGRPARLSGADAAQLGRSGCDRRHRFGVHQ